MAYTPKSIRQFSVSTAKVLFGVKPKYETVSFVSQDIPMVLVFPSKDQKMANLVIPLPDPAALGGPGCLHPMARLPNLPAAASRPAGAARSQGPGWVEIIWRN